MLTQNALKDRDRRALVKLHIFASRSHCCWPAPHACSAGGGRGINAKPIDVTPRTSFSLQACSAYFSLW